METEVTHHVVAMDLVHDFLNFNVLKIIIKIHKKIIKKDPGMILTQGNLLVV